MAIFCSLMPNTCFKFDYALTFEFVELRISTTLETTKFKSSTNYELLKKSSTLFETILSASCNVKSINTTEIGMCGGDRKLHWSFTLPILSGVTNDPVWGGLVASSSCIVPEIPSPYRGSPVYNPVSRGNVREKKSPVCRYQGCPRRHRVTTQGKERTRCHMPQWPR